MIEYLINLKAIFFKYCIINAIVLQGSFNWTPTARMKNIWLFQ